MRMKVPLAGPHQEQMMPESSEKEALQQFTPLSRATQQIPQSPPGMSSQAPKTPGFLRFLPYFLSLIFIGVIIFLGFRFVPALLKTTSGPVELTYWGLWEEEAVMNSIISDFQRQNPNITIKYQKQNIKQYRERLVNKLDSQQEAPDIFRFHNTWGIMLKNYLSTVPSNVYTNEEFEKIFYPVAVKDLRLGNGYIGIPLMIDTLALFINEDDFKAIGEAPPKTWDELRHLARIKLTTKDTEGRIKKAGVALGTFDNVDHASDILALMMLQAGVDLKKKKITTSTSRDGRVLAEDVLNYYVNEFAKGDIRTWDATLDPSTLAFAKEKLSMYFGYSWRIFAIRELNPQLSFRVVAVPQLPEGKNVTFASYWVEGVSKKSRFQKEAFIFLKYLSSKETMQKLFTEQSKLRLFGEPYSRVDLADSLKTHQYLAPFIDQAQNASSWYLASNTYDNGLNDQMIRYFADAVNAVGRGVSAKTALETVAKGVDALASRYGF